MSKQHEAVAKKIITAMVKHPIKHDGIPKENINPGFQPAMINPIWDDIGAELVEIRTDTMKRFDVEFVITLPQLHEIRNTRTLELFEFTPEFYAYKPVSYGVLINFGGVHSDGTEYGFSVYMGDIDFERDS